MVNCVRCNVPLEFQGVKEFLEGRRWGNMVELGETFAEKFEGIVYVCPTCGAIELFHPEIGKEMRTDNPLGEGRV
jgi:hypothetical protein